MRFFSIFLFLLLLSCSAGKKVFICGDRECINKKEAERYFAENLTIEIKIFEDKKFKSYDLVKLNTENTDSNIQMKKKSDENKNKELTDSEKKMIEKKYKEEKKIAKLREKKEKNKIKEMKRIEKLKRKEESENIKKIKKEEKKIAKLNKKNNIKDKKTETLREQNTDNQVVRYEEICSILNKCDIDEISEYLMKKGKNKGYPDLSIK